MKNFIAWLNQFLAGTGKNILTASVCLCVGLFIVRIVGRLSKNSLQKTNLARTTVSFVVSVIKFILYVLTFYFTIVILFPDLNAGVVAILGSSALAIGLALKDSLSDFASGIMIIFNKPFQEGDYVEMNGCEGTIRSIHLLYTELYTPDNKKIIINNSRVNSNSITNYSARPTRRVDLTFSVAYGSDINKVKALLSDIAKKHPLVLDTPEPLIRLYQHGSSALIFRFRVWVNTADYWTVYYDINEQVYECFTSAGIEIPYQHISLNIKKEDKQ